jgi:hypothetical protein
MNKLGKTKKFLIDCRSNKQFEITCIDSYDFAEEFDTGAV